MKLYISEHPRLGRNCFVLQESHKDKTPTVLNGKVWTDGCKDYMFIKSDDPLFHYIDNLCPKDPSKYVELEI